MTQLSHAQRAFIQDNPFVGVATTLRADGSPHSTVVWVDATDDTVSFNTPSGSAKARHLAADPRLTIVVLDPGDAFRWVGVSGTAQLTEDGADAQIDRLAEKYLGVETYPFRRAGETRVSVTVSVERVDGIGLSDESG